MAKSPWIALLQLGLFILIIFLGFPIAFTLMALGVGFGYWAMGDTVFNLVVQRVRSPGSEHVEDQEIFRRLSVDPEQPLFDIKSLDERIGIRIAAFRRSLAGYAGITFMLFVINIMTSGGDPPWFLFPALGMPMAGVGAFLTVLLGLALLPVIDLIHPAPSGARGMEAARDRRLGRLGRQRRVRAERVAHHDSSEGRTCQFTVQPSAAA